MKYCRTTLSMWIAVIAAVVLTFGVCACSADTVVVKPDDMHGWVLATQDAVGGSPIAGFRMAGPGETPAGTGSFHFFTDVLDGADPLEKIYLGTNNHAGTSVRAITSFRYYTYLHARTYASSGQPLGQPPEIELITDKGTSPQLKMFVYKPWGWFGGRNVLMDTWQEWDLMAADDAVHDCWELLNQDDANIPPNLRGNWNWLINRYGDEINPMRIAIPAVGDFKNGYANESGTGLSIKVGSGQTNLVLHGSLPIRAFWKPDPQPGEWLTTWAWWKESNGIDAYADKLVIGIDGVETVYDFERGTAMTVGIGTGACRDHIIAAAKDNFFFVVFGKVISDPAPTPYEFYLDDGSGKKIRVIASNVAYVGEYFRARGTLEWNSTTSRYDLASDPYSADPIN